MCAKFATDGRRVVTCGFDRVAILWNVGEPDPECLKSVPLFIQDDVESLLTNDVLTVSSGGTVTWG